MKEKIFKTVAALALMVPLYISVHGGYYGGPAMYPGMYAPYMGYGYTQSYPTYMGGYSYYPVYNPPPSYNMMPQNYSPFGYTYSAYSSGWQGGYSPYW